MINFLPFKKGRARKNINFTYIIVIIKNIPMPEYYAALPLAKIDKLRYNKCVCKYKQYFMEGKV